MGVFFESVIKRIGGDGHVGKGWRLVLWDNMVRICAALLYRMGTKAKKERTHLRAIGRSLDDAVDELGAVALGEDAFRVESQVPGYGNRHVIHIHFRRDGQSVRVLVVAAREVVAADGAEVRQDVFRLDIAVADASLGHGYLG